MGLQQVGLTEEQWSTGHRSAAAMVRPFLKGDWFKEINQFSKYSSVAGRKEFCYPTCCKP